MTSCLRVKGCREDASVGWDPACLPVAYLCSRGVVAEGLGTARRVLQSGDRQNDDHGPIAIESDAFAPLTVFVLSAWVLGQHIWSQHPVNGEPT